MKYKLKSTFTLEYSYFQNALFTGLYTSLNLMIFCCGYKSCKETATAQAVRL
jgi:hypothetical protein